MGLEQDAVDLFEIDAFGLVTHGFEQTGQAKVLVDLDASVVEVNTEQRPEVEGVVQRQAHADAGQVAPFTLAKKLDFVVKS